MSQSSNFQVQGGETLKEKKVRRVAGRILDGGKVDVSTSRAGDRVSPYSDFQTISWPVVLPLIHTAWVRAEPA